MSTINKVFLGIIILLVVSQTGLFYLLLTAKPVRERVEVAEEVKADRVYGGILPHHLMVSGQISEYLKNFASPSYETVILVGPNHFNSGQDKALTTFRDWQTSSGVLKPEKRFLDRLIKDNLLIEDDRVFNEEHSIYNLTPDIKKYFPNATFVPIILKPNYKEDEGEKLAQAISDMVDSDKVLFLASVDFSHYQPAQVAEFHDLKSRTDILSFNLGEIHNLEIDSSPAISLVLNYLKNIKAERGELYKFTNSGYLIGDLDEPATTHNFFYFRKGSPIEDKRVSMLFFGDIMLDRHVGEKIKQKGNDYPLAKIAGQENRFFSGIDLISANLEGAVTDRGAHYAPILSNDFAFSSDLVAVFKKLKFNFFNLANNHLTDQGQQGVEETRDNLDKLELSYSGCADGQVADCSSKIIEKENMKIGMAGFSMVYKNFDLAEAVNAIKELKTKTDLVVVNIHWGEEYNHDFNKNQQQTAYALIDAGANIIIGHHPHVVEGLEIYKGKLIFYSLGNFIFDQYFSTDTQEELSVGIDFSLNKGFKVFLFPLISKISQPELMKGKQKRDFLEKLVGWSKVDDNFKAGIIKGEIEIK